MLFPHRLQMCDGFIWIIFLYFQSNIMASFTSPLFHWPSTFCQVSFTNARNRVSCRFLNGFIPFFVITWNCGYCRGKLLNSNQMKWTHQSTSFSMWFLVLKQFVYRGICFHLARIKPIKWKFYFRSAVASVIGVAAAVVNISKHESDTSWWKWRIPFVNQ